MGSMVRLDGVVPPHCLIGTGQRSTLWHMPGLNTQLMTITARNRFCGFRLRLPPATGGSSPRLQLAQASSLAPFSRQQAARGVPQSCPPALFLAASDDTRDVELQRVYTSAVDTYLSRVCDAIGRAHEAWRAQARLVQVLINAVQAIGGSLQGGGLATVIRQRAPRETPWQRSRTEAIATAIGLCWENWQRSVSLSGLPLYPSFAAFPGPMAPPTPNVPVPVIALTQNPVFLSGS